jgi:hypothetical protein
MNVVFADTFFFLAIFGEIKAFNDTVSNLSRRDFGN